MNTEGKMTTLEETFAEAFVRLVNNMEVGDCFYIGGSLIVRTRNSFLVIENGDEIPANTAAKVISLVIENER